MITTIWLQLENWQWRNFSLGPPALLAARTKDANSILRVIEGHWSSSWSMYHRKAVLHCVTNRLSSPLHVTSVTLTCNGFVTSSWKKKNTGTSSPNRTTFFWGQTGFGIMIRYIISSVGMHLCEGCALHKHSIHWISVTIYSGNSRLTHSNREQQNKMHHLFLKKFLQQWAASKWLEY